MDQNSVLIRYQSQATVEMVLFFLSSEKSDFSVFVFCFQYFNREKQMVLLYIFNIHETSSLDQVKNRTKAQRILDAIYCIIAINLCVARA